MKTNEKGFSLIEIVVIIFVAAIILPAIIIPFAAGVRDLNKPVIRGTLAFLAQEEMESKVICFNYQSVSGWSSTAISGFPGYSSQCSVTNASFGEVTADVHQISLTVTSGSESLTLVTVKTAWQ